MFKNVVSVLLAVWFLAACGDSHAAPAPSTAPAVTSTVTVRPATGPGSAQCTSVATLPCPALPAGQWYDLNIGVSQTLAAAQCDDGSRTWYAARITLTAMTVQGENVSGFRDWCVPSADPTRADTGLPWGELFNEVARQAN
jgi:hypothetical protein